MSMMTCTQCSRAVDTDFNAESCDTGQCICPNCEDRLREQDIYTPWWERILSPVEKMIIDNYSPKGG